MNNIIVLYENYTIYTDDNMGYIFELKECKYIKINGEIGLLNDKEAIEQANNIEIQKDKDNSWVQYSSYKYPKTSIIYVRKDFKEMFEKYRKPGRTYTHIMKRMTAEILSD